MADSEKHAGRRKRHSRQPGGERGVSADSTIPWLLIEAGHDWIRELVIDWEGDTPRSVAVKRRERHSVVRLERRGAVYYVKRYRMKRRRFLTYALFGSKAWREWQALRRCVRLGIPVSRPLAYGHRALRLESEWYLLLGSVPGTNLFEQFEQLTLAGEAERVRRLLRLLGEFARGLHQRGFFHADLKVQHIIWNAAAGQLSVIDLDGAYFPWLFFAERKAKNLLQILKSLPEALRRPDALEPLLEGYQQAGRIAAVERSLRRKARAWFAAHGGCE